MRRKLLIVLLAIGTVGGYSAGFRSLRACRSASSCAPDARRHHPSAEAYEAGYQRGYADALGRAK